MQRDISDPDVKAIIQKDMAPAFKKGRFAEGLEAGLGHLMGEGRRYVVNPGRRARQVKCQLTRV